MSNDRFTDAELVELLVAVLVEIRPDRDRAEAERMAREAVARREVREARGEHT